MYQANDLVIYKRDVCQIKELKTNTLTHQTYYVMIPINDQTLKINVPIENKLNYIRNIMTKEEAEKLINKIPSIPTLDINNKNLDNEYKTLFDSKSMENLITIIKTSYLRNELRQKEGKKLSEKDNLYLEKATKSLYDELRLSLKINKEEVKNYIENQLKK